MPKNRQYGYIDNKMRIIYKNKTKQQPEKDCCFALIIETLYFFSARRAFQFSTP